MNFTDSPLEKLMKEVPRPAPAEVHTPPSGSPCRGCSFWQGRACVGTCAKQLLDGAQSGGSSGHFVPNSTG